MDPELVLAIVGAALFGVVVWVVAVGQGLARQKVRCGEPRAWWRLTLPLFIWLVAFAFLWGWSLREPNPADERAGLVFDLLAALSSAVALRALWRSRRALRSAADARVPVVTVGLFKPQILVSEEFRRRAGPEILTAALAHERAHVAGRDPLRIWLAWLAADLQWPIPGAARRFSAWLLALEAARDSEALGRGVAAEDLAEAILMAARLQCGQAPASASAAGSGEAIAWRVRRLLSGDARTALVRRQPSWAGAACAMILVGAVTLGLAYGDTVLRALVALGR